VAEKKKRVEMERNNKEKFRRGNPSLKGKAVKPGGEKGEFWETEVSICPDRGMGGSPRGRTKKR